jgi:hypothetical protein
LSPTSIPTAVMPSFAFRSSIGPRPIESLLPPLCFSIFEKIPGTIHGNLLFRMNNQGFPAAFLIFWVFSLSGIRVNGRSGRSFPNNPRIFRNRSTSGRRLRRNCCRWRKRSRHRTSHRCRSPRLYRTPWRHSRHRCWGISLGLRHLQREIDAVSFNNNLPVTDSGQFIHIDFFPNGKRLRFAFARRQNPCQPIVIPYQQRPLKGETRRRGLGLGRRRRRGRRDGFFTCRNACSPILGWRFWRVFRLIPILQPFGILPRHRDNGRIDFFIPIRCCLLGLGRGFSRRIVGLGGAGAINKQKQDAKNENQPGRCEYAAIQSTQPKEHDIGTGQLLESSGPNLDFLS